MGAATAGAGAASRAALLLALGESLIGLVSSIFLTEGGFLSTSGGSSSLRSVSSGTASTTGYLCSSSSSNSSSPYCSSTSSVEVGSTTAGPSITFLLCSDLPVSGVLIASGDFSGSGIGATGGLNSFLDDDSTPTGLGRGATDCGSTVGIPVAGLSSYIITSGLVGCGVSTVFLSGVYSSSLNTIFSSSLSVETRAYAFTTAAPLEPLLARLFLDCWVVSLDLEITNALDEFFLNAGEGDVRTTGGSTESRFTLPRV